MVMAFQHGSQFTFAPYQENILSTRESTAAGPGYDGYRIHKCQRGNRGAATSTLETSSRAGI